MRNRHVFQFGHLELMDTYAVITCNEASHIDFGEVKEIQSVLVSVYRGKKFGLIANRVNTYSINPLAVKDLFYHDDLVAGAIAGETRLVKLNAELENMIITGAPIKHFNDIGSAADWINAFVIEKRDTQ